MIGELTAGLVVSGRRVPEQMVAAVMPFVVEVCRQPKVVAKWTMYIGQRWMRGTGADLERTWYKSEAPQQAMTGATL